MCATCGGLLDGRDVFDECFPQDIPGESPPLVVRNGRLVAVSPPLARCRLLSRHTSQHRRHGIGERG